MSSDNQRIHPDYIYPKTTVDSSLANTDNYELAENLDLLVNRIKLYRTALLGITSNSQQVQNQQRLELLANCLSKEPSSSFEYNAVRIFYQNYLANAIPNSISEDNFLLQITDTCILNCYNPITDQGISINSLASVLYHCFFKSEISKFFTFSDTPLSEIPEEYINIQLQISVIQTSSVNKFNPTGIVNQALTLWYHSTDIQNVICLKDYSLRAKIVQDIQDFLNKNFDSFVTNPTLCQALAESVYSCARARRIYNLAQKKSNHFSN